MQILGLTGGSGTGKGTISRFLAEHGVGAVDADAVYRDLCKLNAPMLAEIAAAFGVETVKCGVLDRPALAKIVFSDADKLLQLNAITAPYIKDASARAISAQRDCDFVLYDAPTLFETGGDTMCDDVIGVIAPYDERVRRIIARDGLTVHAARARIDAQPTDDFYRKRCRYLIHNTGALSALRSAADTLYAQLLGG